MYLARRSTLWTGVKIADRGQRRVVISDPFDALLSERLDGAVLGWATAKFTAPFSDGALSVLVRGLRRHRQAWWPAPQLARRLDLARDVGVVAVSSTHLIVFGMEPEFSSWRTRLGDEITRYQRDEIMAVRVRGSRWARTPVELIFADHSKFKIYAYHPHRLLDGFQAAGIPVT